MRAGSSAEGGKATMLDVAIEVGAGSDEEF